LRISCHFLEDVFKKRKLVREDAKLMNHQCPAKKLQNCFEQHDELKHLSNHRKNKSIEMSKVVASELE